MTSSSQRRKGEKQLKASEISSWPRVCMSVRVLLKAHVRTLSLWRIPQFSINIVELWTFFAGDWRKWRDSALRHRPDRTHRAAGAERCLSRCTARKFPLYELLLLLLLLAERAADPAAMLEPKQPKWPRSGPRGSELQAASARTNRRCCIEMPRNNTLVSLSQLVRCSCSCQDCWVC